MSLDQVLALPWAQIDEGQLHNLLVGGEQIYAVQSEERRIREAE